MATETATAAATVTFLSWLGTPVELPAIEYFGSITAAHGTYGLDGPCYGEDDGDTACDCDGVTLIHPVTGVRLCHVRDASWRRL